LSDDFVTAVLRDHLGNLWVGTYGGIDLLDERTGKFTHFNHDPADPNSLSSNLVRALYEDSQGTIWVGTGFAFHPSPADDGGLNRFDRETGTFTRYLHQPGNSKSIINNKVRDIRSQITFIKEDSINHLWIGTMFDGINRYDPISGKVVHYGDNGSSKAGFTDNSAWWLHVADDGHLWMTTQEANLFKIDVFNYQIQYNLLDFRVNGFVQDSDNALWLATNDGLYRENPSTKELKSYRHNPENPNSIPHNSINGVIIDHRGDFWMATEKGLSHFDARTENFINYFNDRDDSLSLVVDNLDWVYEDHENKIWISTQGVGLEQFDRASGMFTHFNYDPADTNSISSNLPTTIFEDRENNLWVGTMGNAGINKFNRNTGSFKRYLPGLNIHCHYVDTSGTLWVGTQNGLYLYNKTTDNFISSAEVGMGIDLEAAITSIIGDQEDNLWISTTSFKIFKINKARNHAVSYGRENGIFTEAFLNRSVIRTSDNTIYWGTIAGYLYFNPENFAKTEGDPNLYFSNLILDGSSVIPGLDQPIQTVMHQAPSIQLGYTQNTFTIGFSEINFTNSQDSRIFYLLENYDMDWRVSPENRQASYFRVPPGKYNFKIKIADIETGDWFEKSIPVIIAPPWWRSWWAYGLYLGLFCFSVLMVHRIQKERVVRKERERIKEKELAQAKEIEKAYTELKDTQAQLIHSEKMASLGELTAGIAHEIQNPLNFVKNFSEVNSELAEELEEEINKSNWEEAKSLSRDIKENEKKIVHHGKRAEDIVKSMLQHSRGGSGEKEPTDINALADEYLRLSYHGMRAKDKSFNVIMDTQFDTDLGTINVVSQDIGRAILNLITNAFFALAEKKKMSDEHYEPRITICTNKTNDHIEIKVSDNGPGIPKEISNKIFQPFFSTKPTGEGTGLGLSLSYDIITKGHGGSITVKSEEGEGTEFTIKLKRE
jgi:signal transduction histidine kinase/ligand-binding sensor domain-containing protein